MTRKLVRAGLFAAAVVGFVIGAGALSAQDKDKDKVYSIEDIMKRHTGAKSVLKGVGAQVKEGKWEDAQDGAKLLKAFGESLGKNDPPMGTKESWKKLTGNYKENTANVYKAIGKKDAKAANDALGKIGKSCKECHDTHKGK